MAGYKESATVLFWSLEIMTYRATLDKMQRRRWCALFSSVRPTYADKRDDRRFRNASSFLRYLSYCCVEFKSSTKCDTWEKCDFVWRWRHVVDDDRGGSAGVEKDGRQACGKNPRKAALIKSLDECIRKAIQSDIKVKQRVKF